MKTISGQVERLQRGRALPDGTAVKKNKKTSIFKRMFFKVFPLFFP
jgi:hypothetical protein